MGKQEQLPTLRSIFFLKALYESGIWDFKHFYFQAEIGHENKHPTSIPKAGSLERNKQFEAQINFQLLVKLNLCEGFHVSYYYRLRFEITFDIQFFLMNFSISTLICTT